MIILHFALSGTPPSSECKGPWQTYWYANRQLMSLGNFAGPTICTFVRRDTWSQLMGSGDPPANGSPVSIILEEEEKMLSSMRPSPSLLSAPRLLSFWSHTRLQRFIRWNRLQRQQAAFEARQLPTDRLPGRSPPARSSSFLPQPASQPAVSQHICNLWKWTDPRAKSGNLLRTEVKADEIVKVEMMEVTEERRHTADNVCCKIPDTLINQSINQTYLWSHTTKMQLRVIYS